MYGELLRAAPGALFAALLAAVLSYVLDPILDLMLASDEASASDPLITGLQAVEGNALLAGVIAILLTLIARATVERQLGT